MCKAYRYGVRESICLWRSQFQTLAPFKSFNIPLWYRHGKLCDVSWFGTKYSTRSLATSVLQNASVIGSEIVAGVGRQVWFDIIPCLKRSFVCSMFALVSRMLVETLTLVWNWRETLVFSWIHLLLNRYPSTFCNFGQLQLLAPAIILTLPFQV